MSARARIAGCTLFAVAMGFFEAAVVVDLRRLWELGELDFVTSSLSNRLVLTEVLREIASLVMIAAVGILAGRNAIDRVAHAAIVFGLWDILYYVFLRSLLGWPTSLLEWDILFLIPSPWIGPVLAPILVSAALVVGGVLVAARESRGSPVRPRMGHKLVAAIGGVLVITSFLLTPVPQMLGVAPSGFSWPLFGLGLLIAIAALAHAMNETPSRAEAGRGYNRSKVRGE